MTEKQWEVICEPGCEYCANFTPKTKRLQEQLQKEIDVAVKKLNEELDDLNYIFETTNDMLAKHG